MEFLIMVDIFFFHYFFSNCKFTVKTNFKDQDIFFGTQLPSVVSKNS